MATSREYQTAKNYADAGKRAFIFALDPDMGTAEVCMFDSVISEQHDAEIAITDNPVETGVSMSDHAYAKPKRLTMEVVVSDTPLIGPARSDEPKEVYALAKSRGMIFTDGSARRSVNAWQYILDKAESFAVFDVQTGLYLYKNMMFEKASAETTKDTAGVLRASISLRQVIFASTSTVTYKPREKKVKRQAAKKKDDGRQATAEPEKKDKITSTLRSGTNALGWTP